MSRSSISLDSLNVFLTVYRVGTISGAAHELGLAQPSVSTQISALEKKLGYALFERTTSGVSATSRGRELAERVGSAIDGVYAVAHEFEDRTSDGQSHPLGQTVFLAGPMEFLSEQLLCKLAARLNPEVNLNVRFGLADELIDALSSGDIDVLVSPVQPRRRGISFAPLSDEEFILVASPRWSNLALEDIDAVPVLAYAEDLPIIRRYWLSVFGRKPSTLNPRVITPDLRMLARLAAAGLGMSVLPNYIVDSYLTDGSLIALREPEVIPLNTLYVATRRGGTRKHTAIEQVRATIVDIANSA